VDYTWEAWDPEMYSLIYWDEFFMSECNFNKWKKVADCSKFTTHVKYKEPKTTVASVPFIMISNLPPLATIKTLETDFEV
jgi:hypothetical protein